MRHDLIAGRYSFATSQGSDRGGRISSALVRLSGRRGPRGFVEFEDGVNLLTAYRRGADIVADRGNGATALLMWAMPTVAVTASAKKRCSRGVSIGRGRRLKRSGARNSRMLWGNLRCCARRLTNFSSASR